MADGAVVVVGGTRGIGLELVRHYADAGREVVLHGRSDTVADAVAAGASAEDILGVLRAVAPQVGAAKVIAAAPEIMLALGLSLPDQPQ